MNQTTPIKQFKDFGIKPVLSPFSGEKVSINNILNLEIILQNYKISDSKRKEGTKLLTMQILLNGVQRVVFCGATILMQTLEAVPEGGLPFKTTIIKQDQHLEFS